MEPCIEVDEDEAREGTVFVGRVTRDGSVGYVELDDVRGAGPADERVDDKPGVVRWVEAWQLGCVKRTAGDDRAVELNRLELSIADEQECNVQRAPTTKRAAGDGVGESATYEIVLIPDTVVEVRLLYLLRGRLQDVVDRPHGRAGDVAYAWRAMTCNAIRFARAILASAWAR